MEGNNIVFNLSITIAPVSEVQLALFGSRNENLVATQGGPSTSGEFPGLYQPYPPLPPSSPAPKPPSSPAPKSPKPRFGQTEPQDPIWKRRNAKPIPNLELDPVICGDMNWLHNVSGDSQIFELVRDSEWVVKTNHLEVHSLTDVQEGVVINPPTYPAWYSVPATGKVVAAQFPYSIELLLDKAQKYGYQLDTLIRRMGTVVADYARSLIPSKKRAVFEVLILAGRLWQGVSAIYAALRLRFLGIKVSVYVHGGTTKSEEELNFVKSGGKVYRNLKEMKGQTFRTVIVALENQSSGHTTVLPLFGEWLQHSVVLFLDPPVIKSSYIQALQAACHGSYNISQKTVIFVPFHAKTYVSDHFIDIFVIDGGIPQEVYEVSGIEPFSFKTSKHNVAVQQIVARPFSVKGSKITFYSNGDEDEGNKTV